VYYTRGGKGTAITKRNVARKAPVGFFESVIALFAGDFDEEEFTPAISSTLQEVPVKLFRLEYSQSLAFYWPHV
jgi:hypothetical protein